LSLKTLLHKTTPADRFIFLILVILSLSGIFFIREIFPESQTVLIDADGKPAYVLPLNEDKTVSVEGSEGKTIVEIRGNKVRIIDSPCRNKLCIRQGWIETGGVVCLPNKVVVTIRGHEDNVRGVDAITR
jgi:hypothetical protein